MTTYTLGIHKYYNGGVAAGRINPGLFVPADLTRAGLLTELSAFFPANVFDLERFEYDRIRVDVCHVFVNTEHQSLMLFDQVDYRIGEFDSIDPAAQKSLPSLGTYAVMTKMVNLADFEQREDKSITDVEHTVLRSANSIAVDFVRSDAEGNIIEDDDFDAFNSFINQTWLPLNTETLLSGKKDRLLYAGVARSDTNELTLFFVRPWDTQSLTCLLPQYRPLGFIPFAEVAQHCRLAPMYQDLMFTIEQTIGLHSNNDLTPSQAAVNDEILKQKLVELAGEEESEAATPNGGGFDWESLKQSKQTAPAPTTPPPVSTVPAVAAVTPTVAEVLQQALQEPEPMTEEITPPPVKQTAPEDEVDPETLWNTPATEQQPQEEQSVTETVSQPEQEASSRPVIERVSVM